MTETALYKYATPHFYTVSDFPEPYRDFTVGAFYPNPWKGGWWRFKDAVDYCLTASKSALHTAAVYRGNFLYNRYQMGRDVVSRFKKEPPYAWIIPQDQWDPPVAARLLNWLIKSGIDVYALKGLRPPRRGYGEAFEAKVAEFACPGSVLRMEFDPTHPVAFEMSEEAPVIFTNSPAFNIQSSPGAGTPEIIANYPETNLLMSGYLKGEQHIQRKAAVVDVPLGEGRVLLLGFGVKQRAQPQGTFKLLFNSLYYGAAH